MSVISRSSYKSKSYGRYSRRKAQPNFALFVIAFCLAAFVWGNYQIISPPSCGAPTSVGFMNIDTGNNNVRPCEAGEVPVQKNLGEDLSDRLELFLGSAASVQAL